MNKTEYLERELKITLRRSGEGARNTREALDAANARLHEAGERADGIEGDYGEMLLNLNDRMIDLELGLTGGVE